MTKRKHTKRSKASTSKSKKTKHKEHPKGEHAAHATRHHVAHPHEEPAPRDEEVIEEGLRNIYELDNEDGDTVDMSKLEIVSQPVVRRILTVIFLVLIAVIAGLAGAVVLRNPLAGNADQTLAFDIALDDANPPVSGRATTIEIPYHNTSTVPLSNLEVTVHAPETFILLDSQPSATNDSPIQLNLGVIGPEEEGTIALTGIFWQEPGTAATVQAITRYTPANVSSAFEDIVSESILIEESVLSIEGEAPERAVPGEEQTYTFTVEHQEEETLDDLELRLALPQGFELIEADQAPVREGQAAWSIDDLAKDEPYSLTITGRFASDVEGTQTLLGTVGRRMQETFVPQATTDLATDVLASDLALTLVANGQTGDSILLPGEDLTVNLSLSNRGEEAAEEMKIEFFVESGIDRINLDARSGIPDGDRYGNKINWDGTDLGKLETLRGGESVSIDMAIPTNDQGSSSITIYAVATIETIGGVTINRDIVSSSLTVQIASDLQGSASARYYEAGGTPVGSGPIPPRADEATTYRITWVLTNALNDVTDAVMFAPLGTRADWAGLVSSSQGTVTYDSIADRVRWAAGSVAAGQDPPTATFDIRVTPNSSDLGNFADLLKEGRVTAIDAVTGADLSSGTQEVTTELPNDAYASDQGIVVNQE